MEDSNREIREIHQRMWMSLSTEERLQRVGNLFSFAKALAESRVPEGLSAKERDQFVFRELYGFDLPKLKFKKTRA